jgi:hypothetical protein
MIVIQRLAQAHLRRSVLGVLAEMHIVPARGVLEKMDHAHRVGRLPAIFKPHFRDQFVHRIIERELALIGQHQDGERCKRLGGRSDAEQRFRRYLAIACHIRFAQTANPLRAVTMHNGDRYTGCFGIFEDFFQLLPELIERLGRWRLLSVGGKAEGG